jgi:hypothetical protein
MVKPNFPLCLQPYFRFKSLSIPQYLSPRRLCRQTPPQPWTALISNLISSRLRPTGRALVTHAFAAGQTARNLFRPAIPALGRVAMLDSRLKRGPSMGLLLLASFTPAAGSGDASDRALWRGESEIIKAVMQAVEGWRRWREVQPADWTLKRRKHVTASSD